MTREGAGRCRTRREVGLAGLIVVAVSLGVMAAVSWHSVEEIHYLKTFYPDHFTVQEAFYASGVELIKMLLICLPLAAAIVIGMVLWGAVWWRLGGKGPPDG